MAGRAPRPFPNGCGRALSRIDATGARTKRPTGLPAIRRPGKVKFRGSGPEELIQLADMVCGAVGDFLEGDPSYYQIISAQDLGITRIP